ncbi:MAG TPA: hypothetical protein VD948_05710 [Rhodothermales bacterium]|nr:hypothetical protein [Rhodothermales bacterium]
MELWHNLATQEVLDTYETQPVAPVPPGELFRLALVEFSVMRAAAVVPQAPPLPAVAPAPVMNARPVVDLVPAESESIFSMVHGLFRRRAPRA